MDIAARIKELASVDLLSEGRKSGVFVGHPFSLDYDRARVLVADAWKREAGGIPQGTFLLAFYDNEADDVEEALLLRALCPTKLPTDDDVVASMVEYYKDDAETSGGSKQIDQLTRYEFSFSGLECRILGTFYKDGANELQFGADVENFYSANNYSVVKPPANVLEVIANLREGDAVPGCEADVRIGVVRYSSTRRFQAESSPPPVYVSPADFLAKRTALFGMTRTGKSNTVKKIVQATMDLSGKAKEVVPAESKSVADNLLQLTDAGLPLYKVGQIIFDVNG